jgi:hypothetical protein
MAFPLLIIIPFSEKPEKTPTSLRHLINKQPPRRSCNDEISYPVAGVGAVPGPARFSLNASPGSSFARAAITAGRTVQQIGQGGFGGRRHDDSCYGNDPILADMAHKPITTPLDDR